MVKTRGKLVVFDVDGVILDFGIEGGFKRLARKLGHEKEVERIHKKYLKKRRSGPWGLEKLASLFRGESYQEAKEIAKTFPLVKGAKETMEELKRRGFSIVLSSSNPTVVLEVLQEKLHVDHIIGNVLEVKDGVFTGRLLKKVDRYEKARELQTLINKLNLRKEDVYLVGDSITDIPMSELAGTFVAFNPKDEEIKKKASQIVEGKNLKIVLKFIALC